MAKKSAIAWFIGVATLTAGAAYFYRQKQLLDSSTFNIIGLKKISIRKGKVNLSPIVEINNNTDIGATIKNLTVEAFTVHNGEWQSVAVTNKPIEVRIEPKETSKITPEIQIPLLNAGKLLINSWLTTAKTINVLIKISTKLNGQRIEAEDIYPIEL